jgi:hypothetical protein
VPNPVPQVTSSRPPVEDLFSVPVRPAARSELPVTKPSPILAMHPQVAAEVAKSLARDAESAKPASSEAPAKPSAPADES